MSDAVGVAAARLSTAAVTSFKKLSSEESPVTDEILSAVDTRAPVPRTKSSFFFNSSYDLKLVGAMISASECCLPQIASIAASSSEIAVAAENSYLS